MSYLKTRLLIVIISHSLSQFIMMITGLHMIWMILSHLVLLAIDIALLNGRDQRNGNYPQDQRDHQKKIEETDTNPMNGAG